MSEDSDGNPPSETPSGANNTSSGRRRKKTKNKSLGTNKSFKGKIPNLGIDEDSAIYDNGPNAKDEFARTTQAIGRYMSKNGTSAGEIINAFNPNKLSFDPIADPPDPVIVDDDSHLSRMSLERWKMGMQNANKRRNDRKSNSDMAFSIIIGQCSPNIFDIITASPLYDSIQASLDVIQLLKLIRDSLYTGATTKKADVARFEALQDFMSFQQNQLSNSAYSVKFKELVDRLEHLGLFDEVADSDAPPTPEISNARTKSKEQYYAIAFILKSDKQQFSQLINDLSNSHMTGTDNYPTTITQAFNYLTNYQSSKTVRSASNESGVAYHTEEDTEYTTSGRREQGLEYTWVDLPITQGMRH